MRTYVAGSAKDMERVRFVQRLVCNHGGSVTFDWTGPEGMVRTQDQPWDEVPEHGQRISQAEVQACLTCERLIIVCPPAGQGLGCWIELGVALGAGAQIWVLDPPRDSVFWQHPNVRRLRDLGELHQALNKHQKTSV